MKRFANLPDRDLIEQLLQGQENAFDVLFSRYRKDIHKVVVHYVKNRTVTEDLCQDVFLRIYTSLKRGRYNEQGNFLAWASRIAHNLCMDHLRKEVRLCYAGILTDDYAITSTSLCAESRLVAKQREQQLKVFINHLPDTQKEVVCYRYFEELSFSEIATLMNTSVNTSLGRMRYGLAYLRKQVMGTGSFSWQ